MPKVGGVEFPYTKKGMQKAKAWSEMIGKPIQMEKKTQLGLAGGIMKGLERRCRVHLRVEK